MCGIQAPSSHGAQADVLLGTSLSLCGSVSRLPVALSVGRSVRPCICPSLCVSVSYLSRCLSLSITVYLSIFLSIYLSIYLLRTVYTREREIYIYTYVVSVYIYLHKALSPEGCHWPLVLDLLSAMQQMGINPDVVGCNAAPSSEFLTGLGCSGSL